MKGRRAVMRNAMRLWRLTQVQGRPDPDRVREVASRLIASSRAGRLRVMRAFIRMLKRDDESHAATVESAVALDSAERDAIHRAVERRCGRPMHETFSVDPSVIAGIRIRAAGRLYDDTVRARLLALETS
jgi:F0F1-type ATP synthase delta subunit